MIVLSTWHSLQSSGTGVFTEAFLDCINWCGALHAVGLGLFQKERKRWARVVSRELLRRLWRASETRLLCGRTGVLSKGPAEQNCMKLWRKTAIQLKWELQRTGDPRPCDLDKHSYRWKAELGNGWIREKLCMPVSEMDGRGSQDLWRLLDCITNLRLQEWNSDFVSVWLFYTWFFSFEMRMLFLDHCFLDVINVFVSLTLERPTMKGI